MRTEHVKYLACPVCRGELTVAVGAAGTEGRVEMGELRCRGCQAAYPVVKSIPRFVPRENYASSFGLEWNEHARTQYDSFTGINVSEKRFFAETGWPRDLKGQVILEVGSGSGRFTEQAASTGAMVVSLDYSFAVEANYKSNGSRDNVLIVQGDIYAMPVRPGFFDKLFCFGVLQHTPDVKRSFFSLPQYLKPGGNMAVDVYRFNPWMWCLLPRRWARLITKRMDPRRLYRWCRRYVTSTWRVSRWVSRHLPYGRLINNWFMIADYEGVFDLPDHLLKEWSILDTFDGLSPAYDKPQSLRTMKRWFAEAGLQDVQVGYGFNGISGRGTRPRV